jgi:ferredoxin
MTTGPTQERSSVLDPREGLDALVRMLRDDGHRVVGPVVRDGVIAYDDIVCGDDLPTGVAVEQAPGRWRLTQTGGPTRFAWTPGADSWKPFVFPARQEVLRIRRTDGSFVVSRPAAPERPLALIGARDCEVRALEVLDRVMLDADHPDPRYGDRRQGAFVVAVTCGEPAATCWCTSMGGGPHPQVGYDIRVTEVTDGGHRLVATAGSERGAALLDRLGATMADDADLAAATSVAAAATARMPARLPGAELPARLAGSSLQPHWDVVAERCLSCGNCTMVCPTCFCSALADAPTLGAGDGADACRVQEWASCFQLDHSNLGGRPVRATTVSRYRQWLTHKLQTWPEQFGTNGCVGCGRCTTWCPAGIDIVQEAAALIGTTSAGGHP